MKRKRPDGGRKAWLPTERDALFVAAENAGPLQLAIVLWTYETASRITETLHARWEDIDEREQSVLVDRLKRSESELALPLSNRLVEALERVGLRTWQPGNATKSAKRVGMLFPGVTRCVDRAPKERGFQVAADKCPGGHLSQSYAYKTFSHLGHHVGLHESLCHPHAAKHARLYDLADELAAAGVAQHEILNRLKRLSGHKSYDHLMIYLSSRATEAEIMADLRRGLEKIHQKGVRDGMSDVSTRSASGSNTNDADASGAAASSRTASLGLPDPNARGSHRGNTRTRAR